MKSKILGLIAALLLAGPMGVHAGVILQDTSNSAIQVHAFQPCWPVIYGGRQPR